MMSKPHLSRGRAMRKSSDDDENAHSARFSDKALVLVVELYRSSMALDAQAFAKRFGHCIICL